MFTKKKEVPATPPPDDKEEQRSHVLIQHDNQGEYVVTTFFINERLSLGDRNEILDELSDIDEITSFSHVLLSSNYLRVRWETPDEREVSVDDVRQRLEEEVLDVLTRIFRWRSPSTSTISPRLIAADRQPAGIDWRLDRIIL